MKSQVKLNLSKIYIPFLVVIFAFSSFRASAQEVKGGVDKDSILIGQQVNYTVEVNADSSALVVFPAGQTFAPFEVIDSVSVDTSFAQAKMKLIKRYGLTQFDSGSYTLPQQRILIDQKPFFTDSLKIAVNNVVVDTTKQGLYDIKNIIEVDHASSNWWQWALWILGILVLIGLFLFFIIRWSRKKAEAEKKLPPFEQALESLHKLDEEYQTPGRGADQTTTKVYYSRLTDIVRRYLDEEVYDRSMESTTSELVARLYEEKESGHIDFNKEMIRKLEHVLKTADLTKFARIYPQEGAAENDRFVVEEIVKETHESIPPPTQEELMRDAEYRAAQERKRKRRLIITGVVGVACILVLSAGILIATKGFDYFKDNFIGHPSKELLESDWVTSDYGYPPVTVSTPKVLKRMTIDLPKEAQGKMDMSTFGYGSLIDEFAILVNNTRYGGKKEADLEKAVDGMMQTIEARGGKNFVVKNEKYSTPNGAEGLKTFGSGQFPKQGNPKEYDSGQYVMLSFTTPGVIQQIFVSWRDDDKYGKEMADRILNSVELQKSPN